MSLHPVGQHSERRWRPASRLSPGAAVNPSEYDAMIRMMDARSDTGCIQAAVMDDDI